MDDGAHRDNGRHKGADPYKAVDAYKAVDPYKAAQGQWLMQPQPSMKQIMSIIAERDQAIQERNIAFSDKKAAISERDIAFLQRDTAIAERNNATMERDNAFAALQYRHNSFNPNMMPTCPPGCQISRGVKHIHHPQQDYVPYMNENNNSTEIHQNEPSPITPVPSEGSKSRRGRKPKDGMQKVEKVTNRRKKVKSVSHDFVKQIVIPKVDWKDQDLGLNLVAFDESTMLAPICSCTGTLRQCYKWGNGGWQSACCTNNLSMYPLPTAPNKKHARVGGRKMSGSAFNKLLSRLAAEGHDLSLPVDLKDHWAKHGTNRYITIR